MAHRCITNTRGFLQAMLGRRLFRGSWSVLVVWRQSFQLQRGFLTQAVGVKADCSSIRTASGVFSNWSAPYFGTVRGLRSSPLSYGLEEFFPKTENLIEEGEKTGRPWLARDLRLKSNEDLHKLWYVLLKERNMLLTLKHEAKRAGFVMPGPERAWKVRKSMARIKVVLCEREKAINKVKGLHEEPKETKPQSFPSPPQRKPQRSAKGSRPRKEKKGLNKWQRLVLEACRDEDEKRAIASVG